MKTKYATRLNPICNCPDHREARHKAAFQMRVLVASIVAIGVAVLTSRFWL